MQFVKSITDKSFQKYWTIFQKYWTIDYNFSKVLNYQLWKYYESIIWNYPTLSLLSFPESFYIDLLRQQGCIRNDQRRMSVFSFICSFFLAIFLASSGFLLYNVHTKLNKWTLWTLFRDVNWVEYFDFCKLTTALLYCSAVSSHSIEVILKIEMTNTHEIIW